MTEWYMANPRYKALAQELIDAAPEVLGHIDLNSIIFLEKREAKPKQAISIKKIQEPYVTLLNKSFYIVINEDLMASMDDEHRELEMFRTLYHIDVEEGKMRYPDVYDYSFIIKHFGPDWREKQIPSILDELKQGKKIV